MDDRIFHRVLRVQFQINLMTRVLLHCNGWSCRRTKCEILITILYSAIQNKIKKKPTLTITISPLNLLQVLEKPKTDALPLSETTFYFDSYTFVFTWDAGINDSCQEFFSK